MIWIRNGVTREVFLIGKYAIKIPSLRDWRLFLTGLLCNIQERNFSKTGWPELCPIVWAIPGGWCVVMRRAEPMDEVTWDIFSEQIANSPQCHLNPCVSNISPWITQSSEYLMPVEMKMDSFGILDGQIVAVDYGS